MPVLRPAKSVSPKAMRMVLSSNEFIKYVIAAIYISPGLQ
jgi:hypothetical protein